MYCSERCSLVNEKSKITMRKCGGPEFRALSDNDKVLALKMTESGDITSQGIMDGGNTGVYAKQFLQRALHQPARNYIAVRDRD